MKKRVFSSLSPVESGALLAGGIIVVGGLLYLVLRPSVAGGSSSGVTSTSVFPPFTGGTPMPTTSPTTTQPGYTPVGPLPPGSPAQAYQDQINAAYASGQ